MYVQTNKSQLNNDSNSIVNFQKMHISLFVFYSKFLGDRHTNPMRFFLWDFVEGCIGIVDILISYEPVPPQRLLELAACNVFTARYDSWRPRKQNFINFIDIYL